jgi:hypothetical protein
MLETKVLQFFLYLRAKIFGRVKVGVKMTHLSFVHNMQEKYSRYFGISGIKLKSKYDFHAILVAPVTIQYWAIQ